MPTLDFEHKSGFSRTITDDEFNAAFAGSDLYLKVYGLRQSLADSLAGIDDEKKAKESFDRRFRKICEGSMSVREVTRSSDPVKSETRKLANADLDSWIKAKAVAEPATKDDRKALIDIMMADESRIAAARANVEREAAQVAAATVPDAILAALKKRAVVAPVAPTPAPKPVAKSATPAPAKKGARK